MNKTILATLPQCYSLTRLGFMGRDCLLAASEGRGGEAVLIDLKERSAALVTGLAGGVMGMVPIPGADSEFIAIQRFYPVFCSEDAEIVRVRLRPSENGEIRAEVHRLLALPFVHRIALCVLDKPMIVAATLCSGKASTDDWSRPGAVYALETGSGLSRVLRKTVLIEGLHRNHGMYYRDAPNGGEMYISADEGIYRLELGSMKYEKLSAQPTGDIFVFDADGDGQDELLAISPFHGDRLMVLKRSGQGFDCRMQLPLNFGHALWAGRLGDSRCIISCERGGEKSTKLVLLTSDSGLSPWQTVTIDSGVGAANLVVVGDGERLRLYCCNHAADEIAEYTV